MMRHKENQQVMLLALAGTYAVSQVVIGRLLWPLRRDLLQLQTTTDPAVFRRIIEQWSPTQRARYRQHLIPDTVHPLIYAALLVAAGSGERQSSRSRWVSGATVVAPIASAICDLIENAFHARFTSNPQNITRATAILSGTASRTKWVLALGTATWLGARAIRAKRAR